MRPLPVFGCLCWHQQEFVSKTLSVTLLVLTAIAMAAFAVKWVKASPSMAPATGRSLSPRYIVTTMFVSNFVGIVFSRTLHYQVRVVVVVVMMRKTLAGQPLLVLS